MNKLVRNEKTKDLAYSILHSEKLLRDDRVGQLIARSMFYESNIIAITKHVELMYELGLERMPWVTDICMPIIENDLNQE